MCKAEAALTNAELGELLWQAGREEIGHRRRALEKASRAARFWPDEASGLVAAGRSLTELRAVGPWVAARIEGWLNDPPPVRDPDETRRGFLTYAEVRRTLDGDSTWEATPCADLQMHTTFSDGGLPLEEMAATARALGRSYVAITDHSQTLTVANGMTADRLEEQGRLVDELNRGFEAEGEPFRILRSMEVDLFADGTLDMDDATLSTLDLVLGPSTRTFAPTRTRRNATSRRCVSRGSTSSPTRRRGCTGGAPASQPTGAACSPRRPASARRSSSTPRCGGRT